MEMAMAMVARAAAEDQEMSGIDAPLEMQAQVVKMQNERGSTSDFVRALNHVISPPLPETLQRGDK